MGTVSGGEAIASKATVANISLFPHQHDLYLHQYQDLYVPYSSLTYTFPGRTPSPALGRTSDRGKDGDSPHRCWKILAPFKRLFSACQILTARYTPLHAAFLPAESIEPIQPQFLGVDHAPVVRLAQPREQTKRGTGTGTKLVSSPIQKEKEKETKLELLRAARK